MTVDVLAASECVSLTIPTIASLAPFTTSNSNMRGDHISGMIFGLVKETKERLEGYCSGY
jgi:hypothetical protein